MTRRASDTTPGHPDRLCDPPKREGADTAEWVIVLNDDDLNLVLYNTLPGQRRHIVASETESIKGLSPRAYQTTVYSMGYKIKRKCEDADTLQGVLHWPVRLVNLNAS